MTNTPEVAYCTPNNTKSYVDDIDINISPYPIPLSEAGGYVAIHYSFEVINEIPVGSTVQVRLVEQGAIPTPLPCFPLPFIPIPVGSCTYQIQDLFDIIKNIPIEGTNICKDYFPGNGCQLPMLPGHYGMQPENEPLLLPTFNLPEFILHYLIGTWEVKVEVYDENLKELLCVKTMLKLI